MFAFKPRLPHIHVVLYTDITYTQNIHVYWYRHGGWEVWCEGSHEGGPHWHEEHLRQLPRPSHTVPTRLGRESNVSTKTAVNRATGSLCPLSTTEKRSNCKATNTENLVAVWSDYTQDVCYTYTWLGYVCTCTAEFRTVTKTQTG